jgi:hypothetical protein
MHIIQQFRRWALVSTLALSWSAAAGDDPCVGDMDHVMERECQRIKVEEVMKQVAQAEQSVLAGIKKWNEDEVWKDRSLALFENSVKSFRAYQAAACEVEASSTAGGNGAGDMRLYCEEDLAQERLEHLSKQVKHFGG